MFSFPPLPFSPISNSMTDQNSSSNSYCDTVTVIQTYPDGGQTINMIGCYESDPGYHAWTYYREAPFTSTSSSSSSGSRLSPGTASATSSSDSSASAAGGSGGRGSKSKAWIAAAVIVPLVVLAALGYGAWLCFRRRKRVLAARSRDEKEEAFEKDGSDGQKAELRGSDVPEVGGIGQERLSELWAGGIDGVGSDRGSRRVSELEGLCPMRGTGEAGSGTGRLSPLGVGEKDREGDGDGTVSALGSEEGSPRLDQRRESIPIPRKPVPGSSPLSSPSIT